MEYQVKWTSKFKKSYKLAKKRGLDISIFLYPKFLFDFGYCL
jgi:hypothetical protein